MLEYESIAGFNPFEWEDLRCPICRGNNYVSIDHSAVYCAHCNVQFRVRMTAGDPGCVVDCLVRPGGLFGNTIYAPRWTCQRCGASEGFFDFEEPVCPWARKNGLDHSDHRMIRDDHIMTPRDISSLPEHYYLILKIGDYCSGWLNPEGMRPRSLGFPTQEEWDTFQEKNRTGGPFVTARCVLV